MTLAALAGTAPGKSTALGWAMSSLAGSKLGIWVAHGEGKFVLDFEDQLVLDYGKIYKKNVCLNYVDESYMNTEKYPYNPNGSLDGVTGICSDDGRHMAMMPHPERCFLKWQIPYLEPCFDKIENNFSPWFLMFKNLHDWCKN